MQTVIKRNGQEVPFDIEKIEVAIRKANNQTIVELQMTDNDIRQVVTEIKEICDAYKRALEVEEIQNLVEEQIMFAGAFEVARNYIKYRYERELVRKSNTTDEQIISLIECQNEEIKQENSNKNPTIASVQRDYMAGEVSKDITKRFLLPKDVAKAHEEGLIHFHKQYCGLR